MEASDREWLADLQERYRPEIDDALDDTGYQSSFFQPLESARLRVVWVDGPVQMPNEQGREFHEGFNLYLTERAAARLGDRLLLTVQPELGYVENRSDPLDDSDVTGHFQELAASLRLDWAEVTVGRMPLWWGPGRHGALLLSNNARPFDLLKVSTARPVVMPGILGWLGAVQAHVFGTRLEHSRTVSHPYMIGMRVETRLNPWMELGASRTAQFGGENRDVSAGTIWDVFTGQTENDEDDPGNQLAALDARLIIPWSLQPFEVYGEYGGEDEAGGFFSRTAYIAGVHLPRLGPWRAFEVTMELANTTVPGHDRVWYTSRHYPDGYTHHENIIGHHVGTDGLDVFTELRVHPSQDLTLFLAGDYEEHFRHDPVVEKLWQLRAGFEARAWRGLWVSGFYGFDHWKNFAQEDGREENGHVVGSGLRWEF